METTTNRIALVTGAASGIGRATALRLNQMGCHVVATDRDREGLQLLEHDAHGTPLTTLTADLANPSERDELAAGIDRLDILVNAAGVIRVAPIGEVTLADWQLVHTVNLEAPFFLMQALASRIDQGGSIVNVASTAGKTGSSTEVAPYAASKAGLMSLTRAFAFSLAERDITVNAVCPGVIDTPMQESVKSGMAAARRTTVDSVAATRGAMVPLGRDGTPDEVAALIAWLTGAESRYITGQAINICGGLVTW